MIPRDAHAKLQSLARSFPAVAVFGPRQSGKTTLVQQTFPAKPYVLLEDPDTRRLAVTDPREFLSRYPEGAVLDEIQRAPELFSYLQGVLDDAKTPGLFILTGSQNFLLMESITQSLAGRIALLTLLPLSLGELQRAGISPPAVDECILRGFYPRLYDQMVTPHDLYANYIRTYLERDVRLLKNIQDLTVFHTFLKLCAHRSGQLLNLSSLATDCGITHNTAKAWVSLLETSYIVFLLHPHHRNFNKRLVKMPKLYFYDTGLTAHLADIGDVRHLQHHPLRGALFESLVIADIMKARCHRGERPQMHFWRDKHGHEIDCLVEQSSVPLLIEVKSGKTIASDWFKGLAYYQGLAGVSAETSYLVYGGDEQQTHRAGTALAWRDLSMLDSAPLP